MKNKKKAILLTCLGAAIALLVFLVIWQIDREDANPYNAIFARLSSSNVESISLVVKNPTRDVELSEDEQRSLIALLNRLELGTEHDPDWNTLTGGPWYYPLRVRLTDGTDFILAVSDVFFVIWPDPEAYYFPSLPKDGESPLAYRVDLSSDQVYPQLVSLAEKLYGMERD